MLFQSHSRSKLRTLAILKKLKTFLERRICFLLKNESFQFWTFRKLLRFQSHSTANLLPLAIFKTVKIFFWENHHSFDKKPKFWSFWEILQIQSHSPANLQTLAICKIFMIFLKDSSIFFKKTQNFNFERFENSCYSSRILGQNCEL